jgi:hypothetical protein
MGLSELAKHLSDPARIGLTPELVQKLGIRAEEATRGQLMALEDDTHGHLGVYMLGIYVVDDTDFWDDGEIYWFSIPALVDKKGQASWSALSGLPTGAAPHKCGSLEWMTNISLSNPPLVALIPPDDEIASCVVRIAIYDDDAEPANLDAALRAGLETLSHLPKEAPSGVEAIIAPVRNAVLAGLRASDDDILIDQDIPLRRGEATRFSAGFIASTMNQMARVYLLVRDDRKTEQVGPFALHKGQIETVSFKNELKPGGRLAIFARGADVSIDAFGTLTTETPFMNRAIDSSTAVSLKKGLRLEGLGSTKVVAFYTPP